MENDSVDNRDSETKIEERLRMCIDIEVRPSEMRHWAPERILRFFQGLAAAIRARGAGEGSAPKGKE